MNITNDIITFDSKDISLFSVATQASLVLSVAVNAKLEEARAIAT